MNKLAMKTKTNITAIVRVPSEALATCSRLLLVALAASASLMAQVPNPPPEADLFEHRDSAKATAARTPLGPVHLSRAMSLRGELVVTSDDTFVVINASTDDLGATHVRMGVGAAGAVGMFMGRA